MRDRCEAPPGVVKGISGCRQTSLIDPTGLVVARKYGGHAADHWSVDELLDLSRSHSV